MTSSNRRNPLALAVLICLDERPMHPYEVATILRQRNKHQSVRLNYGSLYAVVASLERRGLIVARESVREGCRPERTIYCLTDDGAVEARDWLTDLLSTPVNNFPAFAAGLSFLPALPPDEVVTLLRERAQHLELKLSTINASREVRESSQIPRVVRIDGEFRAELDEAELSYVQPRHSDIESGSLEGLDWWRAVYESVHRPERTPLATGVSRQVEVGR